MDASENWLVWHRLLPLVEKVRAAQDDAAAAASSWAEMERVLAEADAEEDIETAMPILERSLPDMDALLAGWAAGTKPLSEWDKGVLKRALKAYRKRLKLVRLDDESSSSRNPLSRGEGSAITGVKAPEQYAPEIWAVLVKQGRLVDAGHGLFELPD